MRLCQILVFLGFPTHGRKFPKYLALKNATRILLFHRSEAYLSVLYESIEHADDTVVRLGIKFVLKIESNARGI